MWTKLNLYSLKRLLIVFYFYFKIPAIILHEFVNILLKSIIDNAATATTYSCLQSSEDATIDVAPSKLRQSVDNSIRSSSLLLFDGDSISYRINMSVLQYENLEGSYQSTEVAQLDNFELTHLIPTAIKRSRNFYRIGITDVRHAIMNDSSAVVC